VTASFGRGLRTMARMRMGDLKVGNYRLKSLTYSSIADHRPQSATLATRNVLPSNRTPVAAISAAPHTSKSREVHCSCQEPDRKMATCWKPTEDLFN